MSAIWKYHLDAVEYQDVIMPGGGSVLSVDEQGDEIYVWLLVDPLSPRAKRRFRVLGTGWDHEPKGEFIGTVSVFEGSLIWHVFDCGEVSS